MCLLKRCVRLIRFKQKISYLEITEAIDYAMSMHNNIANPSLDDIYRADKEAKEAVIRKFL